MNTYLPDPAFIDISEIFKLTSTYHILFAAGYLVDLFFYLLCCCSYFMGIHSLVTIRYVNATAITIMIAKNFNLVWAYF